MTVVLKIIAISIVGIITFNLIKLVKPEYSMLISVCCGCLVLLTLLPDIYIVVRYIEKILSISQTGEECIKIFLRCALICQICSLTKSFCRDNSNNLLCSCVDLAEKISVLIVSMPLIESVFLIIKGYIGD